MSNRHRNYKSEMNWRDVKYKRFEVALDFNQGLKFKEQLQKEGLTYMEWAKQRIEEYMNDKHN